MQHKAIFLDKDGTLVTDKPYNIDPEFVVLQPGVIEGLTLLQKLGYLLIVVSNQPGIALGLFGEMELSRLITYLTTHLKGYGITLDAFYFCPHPPEFISGAFCCDCRKPQPGMLLKAASAQAIDMENSWMIGDILHDVEAGNRAGCRTILIANGNETEWLITENRIPFYTASSFMDAAIFISNNDRTIYEGLGIV